MQELCHGGSRLLGLNMSGGEEEEEEEEVPWFAVTCWAERQCDSQEEAARERSLLEVDLKSQ